MILRNYQQSIFNQITTSDSNDLVQLDTGAGKTPIIAKIAEHYGEAIIVCHRNILIKQASEKLAMCGLEHRIVASNTTKRISAKNSIDKVGAHFINPNAKIELVSIDTINSQLKSGNLDVNLDAKIMLVDEAHHLADDNKWASLAETLNIRCVGFTATPIRGDGYPMLEQYGGFFKRIVQADGYQDNATERLISEGYLSEYSAYYAQDSEWNDFSEYGEKGASGYKDLYVASHALKMYQKYAKNRQTICIEPRITNACETVEIFKSAGINAEVIHSGLPQYQIEQILQAFEAKSVTVLVAVDMINEGFDVPDADVLILSRIVKSFGLYRQLCGRVLRPRADKHALILDLNGESIAMHGLPSDPIDWTQRQGLVKRKNLTICNACGLFFKATLDACPECGEPHEIKLRGENTCSHVEKHLFDAHMILKERHKIKQAEKERLKEVEKKKQLEFESENYLEFSNTFESGVLGRRCKHFYETTKSLLQEKLNPADFNAFFKKHNSGMNSFTCYTKHYNHKFDNEQEAQVMKLYNAWTKND